MTLLSFPTDEEALSSLDSVGLDHLDDWGMRR